MLFLKKEFGQISDYVKSHPDTTTESIEEYMKDADVDVYDILCNLESLQEVKSTLDWDSDIMTWRKT